MLITIKTVTSEQTVRLEQCNIRTICRHPSLVHCTFKFVPCACVLCSVEYRQGSSSSVALRINYKKSTSMPSFFHKFSDVRHTFVYSSYNSFYTLLTNAHIDRNIGP